MTEIEAYMRDERFQGRNDLAQTMRRIMSTRGPVPFVDDRQAAAYDEDIAELWNSVNATVDPEREKLVGPLRARALALVERLAECLRDDQSHDRPFNAVPLETAPQMSECFAMLAQVLALHNNPDFAFGAAGIRQMQGTIDQLEEHIDTLIESTAALDEPAAGHPHLRLLEDDEDEDDKDDDEDEDEEAAVYQIKISLKGIRPPIWRRLEVLNFTPLDELHDIIQAAMGWTNSHLHMFEIDGECYAPDPDPLDFDAGEDEADTALSYALGGTTRFTYTYDFGDDWQHTIEIEKTLPVDDTVTYPRCLKGKRACPPEDCGGPWGYQHLLESLADPTHADHADLLDWLGDDFNPESFDLKAINTRLAP